MENLNNTNINNTNIDNSVAENHLPEGRISTPLANALKTLFDTICTVMTDRPGDTLRILGSSAICISGIYILNHSSK